MFAGKDSQFVIVYVILEADGAALVWVALLELVDGELLERARGEAVAARTTVIPHTLHNLESMLGLLLLQYLTSKANSQSSVHLNAIQS